MHYVKHFTINGVDTKQVACIELKGKPNAATEGSVGLLAIDISSPMHDVYKCIGVEGNIYHWELLSSGTCIMSSIITGAGEELAEFPYDKLRTVANYVVKVGDVIIDKEGFLYQVDSVGYDYCIARYNGTQIVSGMPKVGQPDNGKILSVVDGCHAFVPVEDSSVAGYVDPMFDKVNRDIEDTNLKLDNTAKTIAPYILMTPNSNGEYTLEVGKRYVIYADPEKATTAFAAKLHILYAETNSHCMWIEFYSAIVQRYYPRLEIEIVDVDGRVVMYAVDGNLTSTPVGSNDGRNSFVFIIEGATKCLMINDDAYLTE